jgi:hypothetical protein
MPLTFANLEKYRTEFLRFEVASFDYGFNAIIGRPGLEDARTSRDHHRAR